MTKNIISQNSNYPRCVDGRQASVFVEWDGSGWIVSKRGDEAASEAGPQFLGASLLFVRALEELAGKERSEAFDLVEEASASLGYGLQIHIDDHHGEHNFENMSDEEVVSLISTHHTGCGFAKYAWGEAGVDVIGTAKDRHWRIQALKGNHEESGAIMNSMAGQTFNTMAGVADGESRFNTDLAQAEEMFTKLSEMIGDEGFVEKAMDWNRKTYKDVVVALGGVENADEIEMNG